MRDQSFTLGAIFLGLLIVSSHAADLALDPRAEEQFVAVTGHIAHPGKVTWKPDLKFLEALTQLEPEPFKLARSACIVRGKERIRIVFDDLRENNAFNLTLHAGDIIEFQAGPAGFGGRCAFLIRGNERVRINFKEVRRNPAFDLKLLPGDEVHVPEPLF